MLLTKHGTENQSQLRTTLVQSKELKRRQIRQQL